MRKRFVVTGHKGFIGSAVVAEILKTEGTGVDIYQTDDDLNDTALLIDLLRYAKPDYIIHCAGRTEGTREELDSSNVDATQSLFAAVRNVGISPTIVVAGSASVYGHMAAMQDKVKEDSNLHASTDYAYSKVWQESICGQFWREGMVVTVARIFNVLGTGQPAHLFPTALINRLVNTNDRKLMVRGLQHWRDFLDVRDVASALIHIARYGLQPVYNVGSGIGVKVKSIVTAIARAAGINDLEPIDVVGGGVSRCVADVSRLTALGWTQEHRTGVTLTDMVRDALDARDRALPLPYE